MSRILVVCLGNICRSPTAEVVLRDIAAEAGLSVEVDSAGTGDWHIGAPPYGPAVEVAAGQGYDLSPLRARQVRAADFDDFDLILAMDASNMADLRRIAPQGARAELRLYLGSGDVPDPYFTRDFDGALALIEDGARDVVDYLRQKVSAV